MVRLFFATSLEIYSASQFYLSLVTGLDVTQNISTAESPDTLHATLFDIIHYEILYETMLAKENKSLWELTTYCRVRLPYFCAGPIR
jgi:hypothetical protein